MLKWLLGSVHHELKTQTPQPGHKKQSNYVVEQSSFPLIALYWLEIGFMETRL